jgi:hypothetical protein
MTQNRSSAEALVGFEYSLTALLRQRSLELDQLKEELARAQGRVATRSQALATQAARLQALEQAQRQASQSGLSIDVSGQLRLLDCLRLAQVHRAECAAEVERARAEHDKTLDKVRLARFALQANERHRERALTRFNTEQAREALRAADDQYLAMLRLDRHGESTT